MGLSTIGSIAIAGAWGYIGRKFLEAARSLGMRCFVYDPGPPPEDLPLEQVCRLHEPEEFSAQQADLFHLALHPENRQWAMARLLARSRTEVLWILCEKPMAAPERPEDCRQLLDAANRSQAVLLYDFPELYDPITRRIAQVLGAGRRVSIDSIYLQRSKDREDIRNPRNYKRMVHIQYQESVHCMAFALYLLGLVRGGYEAVFADGMVVTACSQPYRPPNLQDYAVDSARGDAALEPYRPPNLQDYAVIPDGKVEFAAQLGPTALVGRTDFKQGAPEAKLRIVRGSVDGKPLHIEADYLEGRKRLVIDGRCYPELSQTNSYAEVIRTVGRWRAELSPQELMTGLYPNPTFAHITYRLSTALFLASRSTGPVAVASLNELLELTSKMESPAQRD